ncbi:SLC16A4 [Branchiostoma lanceolatum]|uniref:SLC16A4 protein n=1 Tax=Branchiostoma lanceolatum TaxID=7740 RepID=A0A8K0AA26_BRALA|nr:SLC16A4 [Branchiostoma lanceolatum]
MPVRYTRPLDGGWGWAVVLAVFMIGACSLGVIRSFGVFLEEFTTQFDQSATATSLVISVCLGLTFGGTLLGVMLSARFGFRPVAMAGGVMAAVGCILTYFSTSIVHLYITVGVMAGLGSSLAMFPSLSLVGKYFDKKRAIANGIAFAGVGVGNIAFPPLFTYLIEEYGWRGSFLIAAGVMLNITAFAALLRPIHLPESESLPPPPTKAEEFHAYINEAFSAGLSDIKMDQPVAKNNETRENIDFPPKSESSAPLAAKSPAVETEAYINEAFSSDLSDIKMDQPVAQNDEQRKNMKDLPSKSESLSPPLEKPEAVETQAYYNKSFSSDLGDNQLDQPVGINEQKEDIKDIPLSNEKGDQAGRHWRKTLAEFKTLLTNPRLGLFIIAQTCFLGFGLFVSIVHITPRARLLGIEQYESAFLVSLISIGDLIGRFLSGFLPTNHRIRRLHWYILLVLATGISSLLSPFAKTYPALAVYCISVGLLVGAGLTLSMTLLADLVGSTRLSDGMGLMTLLMSVSIMGAPPIAGKLYDSTGNYNLSFIFAGCGPVLGGLIAAILLCLGDENVRRESGRESSPPEPVNGARPSVVKSDTMDDCGNYDITRL